MQRPAASMTTATTHNDEDDDDGEELVAQVISENAAEEQGIREEWAEHVGWHRKEDIFGSRGRLRGSATATAGGGGDSKQGQEFDIHSSTSGTSFSFQRFGAVVAVLAACASIWFTFLIVYKKSKKNKRHHRSS